MEKDAIMGVCTLCGNPVRKSFEDYSEDGELVHAACQEQLFEEWEENNEYKDLMGF